MAKFVVAELRTMVLGLSHGVYAEDELGRKAFCLCYSAAHATTIADALIAYKSVQVSDVQSQAVKPPEVKAKKPTVGRKGRKKA